MGLTNYPFGIRTQELVLSILTAEPTDSNTTDYTKYVGSGKTSYGSIWMESDGVHWSYNGTEKSITASYSGGGGGGGGVGDLDSVYSNGRLIGVDEGAVIWTDATTGALDTMSFVQSGAKSGNILDLSVDAALTGVALNIDMNLGLAAPAIYIDDGAGARTGIDISVKDDSSGTHTVFNVAKSGAGASTLINLVSSYAGNGAGAMMKITHGNGCNLTTPDIWVVRGTGIMANPVIDIDDSSTGSAHIIDIDLAGAYTGNVIDFASASTATGNVFYANLDNAVEMTAIHIEGSGVRTQPMIEITTDSTNTAVNLIAITTTGIGTGNILDIQMDVAYTGNCIDIDMNLAVASKAIYLDCGGTTRTVNLIDVKFDGAGNADVFGVTATNTGSGAIFDIDMGGTATGSVMDVDMNAAVGAAFLTLDAGNAIRTVDLIDVTFDGSGNVGLFDINVTNTGSGDLIAIDVTGIHTGDILQITYGTAASTGDAIKVVMGTNVTGSAIVLTGTGARTDDLIKIDTDQTDAGLIFDINIAGTGSGNVLDITYSAINTGDAISVTMADNVGGSALVIDAAGTRTDDVIKLEITDAGATMVFDINIDAAGSGNCIDITYATDAHTGNAIDLNMGTNVAGVALAIASAATGVTGFGASIDIVHSGILVAGADIVSIRNAAGAISSTSNALSVETIGDAGSYAVYIAATGSAEALKVDDGNVVFDENLTVTGTSTLTGAVTQKMAMRSATTDGATKTLTAAMSGSAIVMDRAAGATYTLPAPAIGLWYEFDYAVTVTSNTYKIITDAGTTFLMGNIVNIDTDTGNAVACWSGNGTTHVAVTSNGTTTGGLIGSRLYFVCITATQWMVSGHMNGTGTVATPFATS